MPKFEGCQKLSEGFDGIPHYFPPEVIKGEEFNMSSDWFGFGSLLYEFLTGLPPFYDENVIRTYENIAEKEPNLEHKNISEDAASLLLMLLLKDNQKRLQNVEEIKSHPFFKSVDWNKAKDKKIAPPYVPDHHNNDYVFGGVCT